MERFCMLKTENCCDTENLLLLHWYITEYMMTDIEYKQAESWFRWLDLWPQAFLEEIKFRPHWEQK